MRLFKFSVYKRSIRFLFALILVCTISCEKEVAFDSAKWKQKGVDWQITDFREKMSTSLIKSDTLIGLKKVEILELIGKPEIESESNLQYLVREKYSWNIDPDYISYLFIQLDENGVSTHCYLDKN